MYVMPCRSCSCKSFPAACQIHCSQQGFPFAYMAHIARPALPSTLLSIIHTPQLIPTLTHPHPHLSPPPLLYPPLQVPSTVACAV
jgi:hypothetical protein